jgi:hypothetical protein
MGLELGKSFDRNYNLRIPFLNGFYDIGIYFNKKSTFLLFSVDSKIQTGKSEGVKINMFKNIESSKFCETFLELHNYRKSTLDILNQFKCVKPEYFHEISFVMNETLNLSKIELDDKALFDCLNIYGFTLNSYQDEFLFLITERQNIATKLGKKIVRTSGIQIATTQATHMLNDYHKESLIAGKAGYEKYAPLDSSVRKIIKLDEE